jgi:uncharacterized protein (TIGR02118 family)
LRRHSRSFYLVDSNGFGSGLLPLVAIRYGLNTAPLRSSYRPTEYTGSQEKTMIKVTVMYANVPGARFDHDYYRNKHMPLVKSRMGDSCKHYSVDKGLSGGAPGVPAPYIGMCHILCDSVDAFQKSFSPHIAEIMADIPNYTDQTPVVQVSEVLVG